MPFTPSSDARFEPDAKGGAAADYRVNGTYLESTEDFNFRNDMHQAFEDYQARSDIESRASILAREQAVPGTIFWAAQADKGEVDNVTDGTEVA